ncbi:MAG: glycosyltransferase family 39 protein, partial [Leptospiraceae bacterium]|nr:glycosyltransferase family 39 protein [Leptospiraceae bacterium]
MKLISKPIILIHLSFLLSTIIKSYLVYGFNGPIILEDEFEYKQNAFHIFYNIPGFYIYYIPPLYPFVISVSFLFQDHYLIMKLINVVLTSLTIYPVYFLLKEFSQRKELHLSSIFTLLLPIQFSMPNLVMSENLFLPLFAVFLLYMVRVVKGFEIKNSILAGLFLGLLLLTRYFGVAIPPAIFLFFLILSIIGVEPYSRKQIFGSFLLIGLISSILYLPWIVYSFPKMTRIVTQFAISSSQEGVAISQTYTVSVWFLRYLFYLGIMVSPFLSIIVYSILTRFKKWNWLILDQYLLFVLLLSFSFLCLAAYQLRVTDIFNRYINGRYISYLILPWMIYFLINLSDEKVSEKNIKRWGLRLFSFIFTIIVLVLGYNLHFRGYPWRVAPNYIGSFNFMEGYLFVKYFKISFVYIVLLNGFLILFVHNWKKLYILSILPFFLLNMKAHYRDMEVYINPIIVAAHDIYKENSQKVKPVNIYYSTM